MDASQVKTIERLRDAAANYAEISFLLAVLAETLSPYLFSDEGSVNIDAKSADYLKTVVTASAFVDYDEGLAANGGQSEP